MSEEHLPILNKSPESNVQTRWVRFTIEVDPFRLSDGFMPPELRFDAR